MSPTPSEGDSHLTRKRQYYLLIICLATTLLTIAIVISLYNAIGVLSLLVSGTLAVGLFQPGVAYAPETSQEKLTYALTALVFGGVGLWFLLLGVVFPAPLT